jgi:hypothetical protein
MCRVESAGNGQRGGIAPGRHVFGLFGAVVLAA